MLPTFTAFAVVRLLKRFLPHLVDYAFTARMEDDLDEISNGRMPRLEYLKGFYLGNGKPGLRDRLEKVEQEIDPRAVCSIPIGDNGKGELVEVRVGRYGPYLSCGEARVSVPEDMPPDELTLETALELLAKGANGGKSLGLDPDSGLDVFVKIGRFGPYFQLGDPEELNGEKPKMASLLKNMDPETVTLDEAIAVLNLPRVVGRSKTPETAENPGQEEDILSANGRFGPYLKWGKDTRSIPEGESPLTIDLARALELFAHPKARGRSAQRAKVLLELGEHPESKAPVQVLDGRYGPYVTDGSVNASLPKGETPDSLNMDRAVELLSARAARGPSRRKANKKTSSRKTRKKAKKKTAKKATT